MGLVETLRQVLCASNQSKIERLQKRISTLESQRKSLSQTKAKQMNEIENLRQEKKRLRKRLTECETENRVEIDPKEVDQEFVRDAVQSIDETDQLGMLYFWDRKYWALSKDEFERISKENQVDEKEYVKERFDCEDFARTFQATLLRKYRVNTVGVAISQGDAPHAFNVVVFKDGTAKLFEPQTDEYVEPTDHEKYTLENGMIQI